MKKYFCKGLQMIACSCNKCYYFLFLKLIHLLTKSKNEKKYIFCAYYMYAKMQKIFCFFINCEELYNTDICINTCIYLLTIFT